MNATTQTELVLVRYTVDFRSGMTFCETFKRIDGPDYTAACAESYGADNRCAIPTHAVKVVEVADGWR
jgi:hypothetical protein